MTHLFFGHTRFSVHQYGSGSFTVTKSDGTFGLNEEEYTKWLYDERRLDERTEIFLDLTVPQLEISSRGHELIHVVSVSPSLPDKYRRQLDLAAEHYSFLRVRETSRRAPAFAPPMLMRRVLRSRNIPGEIFGSFRLDDDDVLVADYFDRMSEYLIPEHIGWRVSFSSGLASIHTEAGYFEPYKEYDPKTGAGLLAIHQWSSSAQKIRGLMEKHHRQGHHKVDSNFPTILDGISPGWLRSRHRTQDSTASSRQAGMFLTREYRLSQRRQKADMEEASRLFPLLNKRIISDPPAHPSAQLLIEESVTVPREGIVIPTPSGSPGLLSGLVDPTDSLKVDFILDGELANAETLEGALSPLGMTYKEGNPPYISSGPVRVSSEGTWKIPVEVPESAVLIGVRFSTSSASGVQLKRLSLLQFRHS